MAFPVDDAVAQILGDGEGFRRYKIDFVKENDVGASDLARWDGE